MPNWCANTLQIEGDPDALAEIEVQLRGKQALEFASLMPRLSLGSLSPSYINEWERQAWGTKWEAPDVVLEKTADSLEYPFVTAWGPPESWFLVAAGRNPELRWALEYGSEGDSVGQCVVLGGKLVLFDEYDQSTDWQEEDESDADWEARMEEARAGRFSLREALEKTAARWDGTERDSEERGARTQELQRWVREEAGAKELCTELLKGLLVAPEAIKAWSERADVSYSDALGVVLNGGLLGTPANVSLGLAASSKKRVALLGRTAYLFGPALAPGLMSKLTSKPALNGQSEKTDLSEVHPGLVLSALEAAEARGEAQCWLDVVESLLRSWSGTLEELIATSENLSQTR